MAQPNEKARRKQDLHRTFVAGAKWWEFYRYKATMWNGDIRRAETEAEKRYGKADEK